MSTAKPTLVWFRHDLRLADNPALSAAADRGRPVVPVFLWPPGQQGDWPAGPAGRAALAAAISRLERQLVERGGRLILRAGPADAALAELVRQSGADAVYWNRRYEPAAVEQEVDLEAELSAGGLAVRHFNASLLVEPDQAATRAGEPFRVFTPFWKSAGGIEPPGPLPPPARLRWPCRWPRSLRLDQLPLLDPGDGDEAIGQDQADLRQCWSIDPADRLAEFIQTHLAGYPANRDRPDLDATSRLSPALHLGQIGPRQVWHAVRQWAGGNRRRGPVADAFLRQLGWREFAYHLLSHFPHTPAEPLRPEFARFRWRYAPAELDAWRAGRTGYPLVDAGMRQLLATGWMHNRVRMVAASFLVKHLLLPWQDGARWFWRTLADADLANNTLGWQWSAGCGADAAPYFRILNPTLQARRFDPHGHYVRRWVPELARLAARWVHQPASAPSSVLARAGVRLGDDGPGGYPRPIVEHAAARRRALAAFESIRRRA